MQVEQPGRLGPPRVTLVLSASPQITERASRAHAISPPDLATYQMILPSMAASFGGVGPHTLGAG